MPESQSAIYYAVGESVAKILRLPQAELVRSKGYELLCMTDEVDEYIVEQLREQDGKKFCNIVTDDLGLQTEEEKKELEEKENEVKDVLDFVRETLGDRVAVVRLSSKLVSAPVLPHHGRLRHAGDGALLQEAAAHGHGAAQGAPRAGAERREPRLRRPLRPPSRTTPAARRSWSVSSTTRRCSWPARR